MIGDEGAILVAMKANTVLSRQFVPDASAGNLQELRATLAKNPKAPLMLVADTMDQTYVQQTLPPVSSLSVGKMIKRRLDRDFGASDLKGALVIGREKEGRKDWNFLMIALEKTPQLTGWIDFILSTDNRLAGIYLLSVETEMVLKSLELAMGQYMESGGSEWKFFVSHNKVGGFRQVILRNGRIVFTRLAQPVGESNAEVIAGSIEQEMLSTIEYMKRLSFNAAAGLDVYIVASQAIKEILDTSKFMARNVHVLTPFEVAQYMHIEGATQPTDQFGDVIMASLIAASRKHVLKFEVPQSKKVDTVYQLLMAQRAAGALALLGLVGYSGYTVYDLYEHSQMMEEYEQKKIVEQRRLEDLRQQIRQSNLDIDRISDIIDLYKGLREEMISPLPFIVKIYPILNDPLLKNPVRIQSIDWALKEDTVRKKGRERVRPGQLARLAREAAQQPQAPGLPEAADGPTKKLLPQMTAEMIVEFPAVKDSRELQVVQKAVEDSFSAEFSAPFYTVTFAGDKAGEVKKPEDQDIEITLGEIKPKSANSEPVTIGPVSQLHMTIEGDVIGGNSVDEPKAPEETKPAIPVPAASAPVAGGR